MAIKSLIKWLQEPVKAAPLAVFRILFGGMMLFSVLRFWANGWIEKLYLEPDFHFSYLGFEWVQPLGPYTYLLFAFTGLCALAIALGWHYRWASLGFFLSFTYIELMDKTTYLNHYYFISVVAFVMIFLPAHRYYSLDLRSGRVTPTPKVPRLAPLSIKLLLAVVYFYAGLAKLNSDWLLAAQPLATWLPGRVDLPLIGPWMEQTWLHYAFSWGGALYDLAIPFLLFYRPTRPLAFGLVVFFHLLTRLLFPIGVFPYVMILSSLIFFSPTFHQKLLRPLKPWLGRVPTRAKATSFGWPKAARWTVMMVLFLQLLLPWRYLLYPGELFWHEQGFRFSWRVMLMEKAGYVSFRVVDPARQEEFRVEESAFLTPFQQKQMGFQPDFILEFAHFLEDHYQKTEGRGDLEIYADSYVALNGRPSRRFIDPRVDLTKEKRGWHPKTWILDFDEEIHGL